jgi:hypothetical protein
MNLKSVIVAESKRQGEDWKFFAVFATPKLYADYLRRTTAQGGVWHNYLEFRSSEQPIYNEDDEI